MSVTATGMAKRRRGAPAAAAAVKQEPEAAVKEEPLEEVKEEPQDEEEGLTEYELERARM